jgi:hypothetical protein
LPAAECRLKPPALAAVEIPLAGEQTVAQQPASAPHEASLPEGVRVVHQHLADMIRVGQQERVLSTQSEGGDIPLGSRESQQESVRVGVEPGQVAQQRQAS